MQPGYAGALRGHVQTKNDPASIKALDTVHDESYANWVDLVRRISRDETDGFQELYEVLSKGYRYFFQRQLGVQDVDDRIHDCFLQVVRAIRTGKLREPQRLLGFVRVVAQRDVYKQIEIRTQSRKNHQVEHDTPLEDPGACQAARYQERRDLIQRILSELSERDRQILIRFYIYEQRREQICLEMNLTETQFRLLKSRAKARFGQLGRRKTSPLLDGSWKLELRC